MFGHEWLEQVSRLQDDAPSGPWEKIVSQLTADLGDHPDNVFAKVEHEPLAAASLAQVHRAWLDDGTVLALKVRRPGISRVVEADLRLLNRLAELLESEDGELRHYRRSEEHTSEL